VSSSEPPAAVRRLAAEREEARAARDFATADTLRERIRALGWEPSDTAGGTVLRPSLATVAGDDVGYARAEDLASLLGESPTLEVTLVVLADDFGSDLERLLSGLAASPPLQPWELVIVANAPSFDVNAVLAQIDMEVEPQVLPTAARLGWADAVNAGLQRSRGSVAVLMDTSLEPTGDFLTPLLAAFDDQGVGIAGPWGVVSGDLRHFVDAPPGDVDAIEGYCLAVRHQVLANIGLFDHHFRFYRNADLDFSFTVRAAGWRAVATEPLPLTRHDHRGWSSVAEAERERLSKRNFYRFLKHWGDRRDLLLHPGPRPGRRHRDGQPSTG
jgi:GT2 family glycosyltransferase